MRLCSTSLAEGSKSICAGTMYRQGSRTQRARRRASEKESDVAVRDRGHLGARPCPQCCSAHDAMCLWCKKTSADIRTQLLGIWPFPPVGGQEGGVYGTSLKILSVHTEISFSLKSLSKEMKSRRGRNCSYAIGWGKEGEEESMKNEKKKKGKLDSEK